MAGFVRGFAINGVASYSIWSSTHASKTESLHPPRLSRESGNPVGATRPHTDALDSRVRGNDAKGGAGTNMDHESSTMYAFTRRTVGTRKG